MKAKRDQTVRHEIRIRAPEATVFALLTDARRMTTWLARNVKADPRPGGIFRLVDFGGFWVEGTYLKVVQQRKIVFSWGGIGGLKLGESTAEFTLRSNGKTTLLRLHHFGLSPPAVNAHRFIWRKSGLPKLKAVAEGKEPGGTCLGDAADSREQCPYPTSVACKDQVRRVRPTGGKINARTLQSSDQASRTRPKG